MVRLILILFFLVSPCLLVSWKSFAGPMDIEIPEKRLLSYQKLVGRLEAEPFQNLQNETDLEIVESIKNYARDIGNYPRDFDEAEHMQEYFYETRYQLLSRGLYLAQKHSVAARVSFIESPVLLIETQGSSWINQLSENLFAGDQTKVIYSPEKMAKIHARAAYWAIADKSVLFLGVDSLPLPEIDTKTRHERLHWQFTLDARKGRTSSLSTFINGEIPMRADWRSALGSYAYNFSLEELLTHSSEVSWFSESFEKAKNSELAWVESRSEVMGKVNRAYILSKFMVKEMTKFLKLPGLNYSRFDLNDWNVFQSPDQIELVNKLGGWTVIIAKVHPRNFGTTRIVTFKVDDYKFNFPVSVAEDNRLSDFELLPDFLAGAINLAKKNLEIGQNYVPILQKLSIKVKNESTTFEQFKKEVTKLTALNSRSLEHAQMKSNNYSRQSCLRFYGLN